MGEYIEEEIIEGEPRPGLLILGMSNDEMKAVSYNRSAVIENCRQLALSPFFHVCIDSKAVVPAFRVAAKGAQLVDALNAFDHINHIPKKKDSALEGTTVLETLKEIGITHVCVCGNSTDTSVFATAKDLIANNFDIFVVKDAMSSKNGKTGHEQGLKNIEREFGSDVIVGMNELLGEDEYEEEIVDDGEEWVEEIVDDEYGEVQASAPSLAPAAPQPKVTDEKKTEDGKQAKTKGWRNFGRNKKEAPAPPSAPAPKAKPATAPARAPAPATHVWKTPGKKAPARVAPPSVAKATAIPNGTKVSQVQGSSVQARIKGLQADGLRTKPQGQRRMKTPKIVTDTKETWDKHGNITREITRYITEIDGTKRTEKKTEYIPAK